MSVQDLVSKIEDLQELVKQEFSKEIAGIFEKYPTVNSLSFVAYTPYFSDGDPTIFRLNTEMGNVSYSNSELEDEIISHEETSIYEDNGNDYELVPNPELPKEVCLASIEFTNLVESIPEHIIQQSFEEGEVIFHRDGTVTEEEYDHE